MSSTLSQVETEWVPLLVPDMPSPKEILPWLERMHMAKHYSNFGPLVREFEAEFADRFGVVREQVTTVANATQGLELVLQALKLPQGSHVLIPAFTFVATATAVVRAGYIPVLADVDEHSWILTPEIAREACSCMKIDAVLTVATFGMPHAMGEWQDFEIDTGIPVVIDAAAAYGSQWLHEAKGTLVFSLHTTKSLPAGEGGLVVSSRPGLVANVKQLSNFGINLGGNAGIPLGSLSSLGTNAKMSEYHAAVGLASLAKWESCAKQRRDLHFSLARDIDLASGQRLSWQVPGVGGNLMAPTLMCVRLPSETARLKLEVECMKARVATRRWYQPLLSDMPALQPVCKVLEVKNAQLLRRTLLGVPFFLNMTEEQRQRVVDVVHACHDLMSV